MTYRYYTADVFTDKIFSGAQIAVFPHAESLTDEQMKLIARELNLTETVFVSPGSQGPSSRRMRVFSPREEIDFAGHPIIAMAYVLGYCGDIDLSAASTSLTFEQNAGAVDVNINADGGRVTSVQFSQKVSAIIDRFAPTDEELASFLSIAVAELDHKKYSPRLVSTGFPYLIVPLWNYESVRKIRFNHDAWSRSIAPQTAAQEILLFSPKTPFPDAQFNLRLVGPKIGPYDDPPVGSAVPAFTSYLCSFEFTRKGTYAFALDRGDLNSRRSVLQVEMDNKGDQLLPIRVGGQAVIFSEGQIYV